MNRDKEAHFIAYSPSDRVRKFIEENPTLEWEGCLQFVLNNFPQVENGAIQWLVEGGASVHLLRPARTMVEDVDIVTRSEQMAREFVNTSLRIDVKTTGDWLKFRLLDYNQKREEFLFGNNISVPFRQGKIYVFNPVALAASKTIPWGRNYPKRDKDIEDVRILSVAEESVREFIDQLTRKL